MNRKYLVLTLGLLITVVSLCLALKDVNISTLATALKSAQLSYIPAVILCLVVFYTLKVFRWRRLLTIGNKRPDARSLVGPMMIGFAANNVLPLRLGELARVVVGASRTGYPHGTMIASIVVERVLDVIALLTLAGFAYWVGESKQMTHALMPYVTVLALVAAGCLVTLAFVSKALFDYLHNVESGSKLIRFAIDKARTVEEGLQCVRSSAQLGSLLGNSLLQWTPLATAILISCHAVGVEITFSNAIYLMLLITIAISIPSTPGFIGVIEYSFVLGLGSFGTEPDVALAAAIFYHVVTWVSVTFAGMWFLNRYSLRWADVRQRSRT